MKARCGFTLVEILVVVTILGVLAAIVIPQFQSGTGKAQTSSLRSNLHAVRYQIELYKYHHTSLPAALGETGADFERRLTTKTDQTGAPGVQFGPHRERMPTNPFNRLDTVR